MSVVESDGSLRQVRGTVAKQAESLISDLQIKATGLDYGEQLTVGELSQVALFDEMLAKARSLDPKKHPVEIVGTIGELLSTLDSQAQQ